MTHAPDSLYERIRTAARELDDPTVDSMTEWIREADAMPPQDLRDLVEDVAGLDPVDADEVAELTDDEISSRLADRWPVAEETPWT